MEEKFDERIKEIKQKIESRLNKKNKAKLNELEIFKDKVPFQIANGWADLIYELGKNIEEVCKLANCELPQIEYIKSKYTSLRFDYYFKADTNIPKIVEKLIDSLIYEVEDKSSRICEYCGVDGSIDIKEDNSLILMSCDRCSKPKKNKNWYTDELLESVAHIQEHANKKDINILEYLKKLDGTVNLINKIKEKIEIDEFADFNADDYTSNQFYKHGNEKRFSKSTIIRSYLGTMNKQDIHTLCSKFGKDRVLKELNDKYKELFEIGFVDFKGAKFPLSGDYKEKEAFKELLEMIDSYE